PWNASFRPYADSCFTQISPQARALVIFSSYRSAFSRRVTLLSQSRFSLARMHAKLQWRIIMKAIRNLWKKKVLGKRTSAPCVRLAVEELEPRLVPSTVPSVVLISLDGATPRLVDQYLASGALPSDQGLGLLKSVGIEASQNITITPSLTAP